MPRSRRTALFQAARRRIAADFTGRKDWAAAFDRIGRAGISPWLLIALLWFALIFPEIALRGFHYEEGKAVAWARSMAEEGRWLDPTIYGWRFSERPALMSWMMAAISIPFGVVNQWVARAPVALSLFACGLMVFSLVRRHASLSAALFAVLCVFVSPMMLQKLVTAEPDILLSALLFGAFLIWWDGNVARRFNFLRWIAIGWMLTAAALVKGPQPVAYFTLGVGAFIVARRRWMQMPGFVFAHLIAGIVTFAWYVAVHQQGDLALWQQSARLVTFDLGEWLWNVVDFPLRSGLEFLPGLLLAIPCALALWRRGLRRADPLLVALFLYAACTTLVLILWPGSRTRFAMPATLAIAAMAGLSYDRMRVQWRALPNLALVVAMVLGAYALTRSWIVMTANPDLFQRSRIAGRMAAQVIAQRPGTLYVLNEANNDVLGYVPGRVRILQPDEFRMLESPSWALLSPQALADIRARRPDLNATLHIVLPEQDASQLVELTRK